MKYLIYTLLSFFLVVNVSLAQMQYDTLSDIETLTSRSIYVQIIQNNGQSNYGKIIEQDDKSISILLKDETQVKYMKSSIKQIVPLEVRVTTKDGIAFQGYCTKENNDEMWITSSNATEYKIKKSQIKSTLILKKGEDRFNPYDIIDQMSGSEISTVPQSPKIINNKHNEYPMFGATLGLPSLINLIAGYRYDKFGAIGEFGFIPYNIFGFQIEALYNLNTSRHFEHNIGLSLGFIDFLFDKDKVWGYLELLYNLNIYGFFVEGGMSIGSGCFTNPQLMFQFGYVYRFNK